MTFLFLGQRQGFCMQLLQLFPVLLSALHLCQAEHDYNNVVFTIYRHGPIPFQSNLTKLNPSQ